MSCGKTQEFLANAGVTPKVREDAKKKARGADGARELLAEASEVYIAKGKSVLHFDLAKATVDEVVPLVLGPTGNLRAPTLRQGRVVMVGFNREIYQKLFG